jgi:hypothetical protein
MKARYNIRPGAYILIVLVLAFFISGCMGDKFFKQPEQVQSSDIKPKSQKTTAVYYDFEDILIPKELSIMENRTVIISTPGFTSGIIALKGRIDRRSLFSFFANNMQKDNWNVLSQIKSPGTTIMLFQKASRTAVITIRDEQFYTQVEVGVAPTVTGEADLSGSVLIE